MQFFNLGTHTAKYVHHCSISESEPTGACVVDSHTLSSLYHEFSGAAAGPQCTKYIALPGRWRFSFESLALVSVFFLLKRLLAIILGLLLHPQHWEQPSAWPLEQGFGVAHKLSLTF